MLLTLLTLGGLLTAFAAVPVLIHLINMMRHQRVQWAAMDFLLQSYKKHRNWIWLKQLLLLLARMTAMVLVALMLCVLVHLLINDVRKGMGWEDEALGSWFGGQTTHHYVLLDDSFSMADRAGAMTAFDRARKAIQMIGSRASHRQNQRFTLIRYSQAISVTSSGDDPSAEQIADLNAVDVDRDFVELLEERRNAFDVSQLSVGPVAALNVVQQLLKQRDDEKPIVYVVTDCRAKDWDNPAEIHKTLRGLKEQHAEIELINCIKTKRANLAITALTPDNDIRAAGVPLFMNVTVKNFGDESVKKVQVKIRSIFFDPDEEVAGDPQQAQGKADELPTVLFNEIKPGESATSRVQVYFPEPGKHVVEAELQGDTIQTDNTRWSIVDFLAGVPVLVIDGDITQRNAYFLNSAFEPGRKNTGIRPDVQPTNFLRDAEPEVLAAYHTIYLLDVDRLEESAISNLEEYVSEGGGLGIFSGPNLNIAFYNDNFYREGRGLFPLMIDRAVELPEVIRERVPDIAASEHPVFRIFSGERNTFLSLVAVKQYLKPTIDWDAEKDSNVEIIASLRNGDPFVVEKKFGDGRVVTYLSTMSSEWNNWTGNPTFVVMALKLQAYLSSGRRVDVARVVGAPIELQLDADKFRKDVTFVTPDEGESGRILIERSAIKETDDSPLLSTAVGRNPEGGSNGETGRGGIHEAWTYTVEGQPDVQRYAVNVQTVESNLELTEIKNLLDKLDEIKPTYLHWDEINPDPVQQAGFNWSKWVLLVLIVLLIVEQVLAYVCSYHPLHRGNR